MSQLNTTANLIGHDDLYQMLIDMHEGLDPQESAKANAKVILLLANHIGDPTVVAEALTIARDSASR